MRLRSIANNIGYEHTRLFAFVWAIIFASIGTPGFAQTYNFEKLTISDGLSPGMIYDIELTDDGFLWFGTKEMT